MVQSELPKPGDVVGVRYRIESMLGEGGMGAVFAAVNQATGRAVAIKWMLPGVARSQEALARFLAEAQATAKIEHPNVIQILDVGQDGSCPFLVMERLRGRSLADRLEKQGRMTPQETLAVLIPACRGVAEAHSEGIIHRDLKPDNIFLCEGKDGSPRPPKVLDFGISKLYHEGGGPSLTRTGVAMGTPQYMSPEQLNAPPDADARFDVYAMGVVLYECLVGRPPYHAEGLFELVQQIAAGNPAPIRFLAPAVPADLEAVVMRAMAVRREARHPTMPDLVRELERVQQRMQHGAQPPSVPLTLASGVPSGHPAPTGPLGAGASWGAAASMHASTFGHGPHTLTGSEPVSVPVAAPTAGRRSPALVFGLLGALVVLLGLVTVGVGVAFYALVGREPPAPLADPAVDPGRGAVASSDGDTAGSITTNSRAPRMDVRFSGDCSPRFNARLMVTGGSGSVNVISSSIGGITGSIMLYVPPDMSRGTSNVSSRARIDNHMAINVMAGQRLWTNMSRDIGAVHMGRATDTISGSITLAEHDSELARLDVIFDDVVLQNVQDGSLCRLDGRLQTFGTTYGM